MRKKILLIKVWAIGEVALSTPCIDNLRSRLPDAEIHFLVGKNAKDIIIGNPDVKNVFPVDEDIFLKPDLSGLIKLVKKLRKEKFDIIITLHYNPFFSLLGFLIGAPLRVGLKRYNQWSLNTLNLIRHDAVYPRTVEYLKALELLPFSASRADRTIAIYPSDEDRAHIAMLMKENSLTAKRFIIVSPTGGENPAASKFSSNISSKVWPLEYYKELSGRIINSLGYKVVIVGGTAEKKKARLIKYSEDNRTIDLTGKTNLRELTLLGGEAAISVTNDSGPMHLLGASGAPAIVIFGPTDPELLCPGSEHVIIMKGKADCSPCCDERAFPVKASDCENILCMRSVMPETVFQKIREVLSL